MNSLRVKEIDESHFQSVPVIQSPDEKQWADIRKKTSSPYIIRGITPGNVLQRWSNDYLVATAGHQVVPVEYSVRGITRLDARINNARHLRKSMTFTEALNAVDNTPVRGVTHYVSSLEISRLLPELESDIEIPPIFGKKGFLGTYFFAGAEGTGSGLHYDPTDNYIYVLKGTKEVLFFPPGRLRDLSVAPIWQPNSNVSRLKSQDMEDYAYQCKHAYRCLVEPSDFIYLPRNWWHVINNRGSTLALSFCYQWPLLSLIQWRQARLLLRLKLEKWLSKQ